MKQKSANEKTSQRNSKDMAQGPSAGATGLAIAPPVYGLDSIDQELSETQANNRAVTQRRADRSSAGGDAGKRSENKTGLPDNLKARIESLSGLALDNVRVHYNSPRPAQLQALAYTQGTEIHVAPGQEQHLPHEAWHVVQQAQGRVKPTMQMKGGVPVNNDEELEHEADVMGAKAALDNLASPTRFNQDRARLEQPHPQQQLARGLPKKGAMNFLSSATEPTHQLRLSSESNVVQLKDFKSENILPEARKHYNEPWGYNISNDEQLLEKVNEKDWGIGNHTIELGYHKAPNKNLQYHCTIKFQKIKDPQAAKQGINRIVREIWHCGPSGQGEKLI